MADKMKLFDSYGSGGDNEDPRQAGMERMAAGGGLKMFEGGGDVMDVVYGAGREVKYKKGALKADGDIKKSWLREKAKGKGKTAQRARLALTLGKMKKK
jgi:hypothetical protein